MQTVAGSLLDAQKCLGGAQSWLPVLPDGLQQNCEPPQSPGFAGAGQLPSVTPAEAVTGSQMPVPPPGSQQTQVAKMQPLPHDFVPEGQAPPPFGESSPPPPQTGAIERKPKMVMATARTDFVVDIDFIAHLPHRKRSLRSFRR
jgi:hypothetical protein